MGKANKNKNKKFKNKDSKHAFIEAVATFV